MDAPARIRGGRVRDSLPSWDELVAAYEASLASSPWRGCATQIKRRLVGRPPPPLARVIARLVDATLGGDACRRVLAAPWQVAADLYLEQVARNLDLSRTGDGALRPDDRDRAPGLRRPHHQLPCSDATVADRVEAIANLAARAEPVLLLGDDDLLSAALIRTGFEDVTVLDIDPDVIAAVRTAGLAAAHDIGAAAKPPRLLALVHDLRRPPPAELVRAYRAIVSDPPCTPRGVRLFVRAALVLRREQRTSRLLLCTHFMSQLPAGLRSLQEWLEMKGLRIESVATAASAYPLPPRLRAVLRATSWLLGASVTPSPALRDAATVPCSFVSDAVVLRRDAT